MKWTGSIILAGLMVACGAVPVAGAADAREILDATGVKGGLVVHVGCGDGKLTAKAGRRWIFNREVTKQLTVKELSAADVKWSQDKPKLIGRAMVLAGKTLFVAGPPDVLDEEAAIKRRWDDDVQKQLVEQDAALLGKKGALLWAVSAGDGKKLAEYKLESPPVWDGMAAANGRLFLSLTNGKLECWSEK